MSLEKAAWTLGYAMVRTVRALASAADGEKAQSSTSMKPLRAPRMPEWFANRALRARWVSAFAVVLCSQSGRASEPNLQACVSAYEQGQQLLRDSRLIQARRQLLVCARAPCPVQMWNDCLRWLDQADERMPSVVLAARRADGQDVFDVRVTLDGQPLVEQLDARAIEVDPGDHTFRFERGQEPPVETRVLVREGEKAQLVTVTLGVAPSAEAELPTRRPSVHAGPPVSSIVLGALGVTTLASFTYFGLSGRADYLDLEQSCAPGCTSAQVTPGRTKLIVADVSLGISVVSLGIAAYLWIAHARGAHTANDSRAHGHLRVPPSLGLVF
jgi:hypothetical protein